MCSMLAMGVVEAWRRRKVGEGAEREDWLRKMRVSDQAGWSMEACRPRDGELQANFRHVLEPPPLLLSDLDYYLGRLFTFWISRNDFLSKV